VLCTASGAAAATRATDTLRPAIDEVLRILDDPALKGTAHTQARRAARRGVIERVVDFSEAARRALALQTASYAELLRRIKGRVAELTAASST